MTSIQAETAELHVEPRLQHLIYASIQGVPREDVTHPIIIELLLKHKHPDNRFTITRPSLRWRPEEPENQQEEVPHIAVGHLVLGGSRFMMRFGIKSKRMVDEMRSLPEPLALQVRGSIQHAFHILFFQGEDQAKAAIEGGRSLPMKSR
jgi:hypothetical protein